MQMQMMWRSKLGSCVALALVIVLLAGCFGGAVSSAAGKGTTESRIGVSLFWGLTTTRTQAVECQNGLAEVEVYWPWWSAMFISPLTAGIITPIKKVYTCTAPAARASGPAHVVAATR